MLTGAPCGGGIHAVAPSVYREVVAGSVNCHSGSYDGAFEQLERLDGKLSRAVPRGRGGITAPLLPDPPNRMGGGYEVRQNRFDTLNSRLSFLERSINRWDAFLFAVSSITVFFLIWWHCYFTEQLDASSDISAWHQLAYDIIPEVLGALIVFAFSYVFLRIFLNARAERETLQIAKIISDELADHLPDIEGISKLKVDRKSFDGLIPFDELIRSSQRDISLLATQHGYVVKQQLKLLGEMAELGRNIRILMMSPHDENGNVNPLVQLYEARYINYQGLQSELEINKQRLLDWHAALPPRAKKNVQLRVHFDIPVGNFTLIDRDLSSGVVQVEPYIFANLEVGELVVYVAYNKTSNQFFGLHTRTFDWLWQRGQDIVP
jgi:hypothetical protein